MSERKPKFSPRPWQRKGRLIVPIIQEDENNHEIVCRIHENRFTSREDADANNRTNRTNRTYKEDAGTEAEDANTAKLSDLSDLSDGSDGAGTGGLGWVPGGGAE